MTADVAGDAWEDGINDNECSDDERKAVVIGNNGGFSGRTKKNKNIQVPYIP